MIRHPDLFDVMERRDTGIGRVVDKADALTPGWSDGAYAAVCVYCKTHPHPFLLEEVREWAEAGGHVPPPHDGRSWGAVIQRARRAGVVRQDGFGPARSSNLSPKVRWTRS
jgi:hypothetical protein